MNIPYFPWYPQDWLADPKVERLTLEERGAYFELLNRMWVYAKTDCYIPDDPDYICRALRVRRDKWLRLRQVLVEGPNAVLTSEESQLISQRLREEFKKAQEKSQKAASSARQKSNFDASKATPNQETGTANAQRTHSERTANAERTVPYTESDTEPDTDIKTDRQTAMAYFGRYFPAHLAGGKAAKVFADYGEEMGWDVALEALKRTTAKDKDWSYAAAILRNWSDAGVKSMAGVQVRDDARRKTAVNGPSQPTKRDKWKPASPPTEGKHEQLA